MSHYYQNYQNTTVGHVEIANDPNQFSYPHYPHRGARGGGFHHRGGGGGHYNNGGNRRLDRGGAFMNTNRFVDFNKPWINQEIRSEIFKKKSLSEAAKRSKTADAVALLQNQSDLVDRILSEAKIKWLAANPDMEAEWLAKIAAEESNKTYFCDVCEKMVGSSSEYQIHVSQHATCGIDGCSYTAHQDILEKHIMHQHLTGFYNRIVQGNTPEDIEKWRAERRKNFPTQMKIAEKIVVKETLKERGEVMHLKREKRRIEAENHLHQPHQKNVSEHEQTWECNCKARQFVESMRGRRRNWVPRNVKHQRWCKELENIKNRAKEKQERRQAAWEERRGKRKIEKENENANATVHESKPIVKRIKTDDADSCSEDDGWNGGLWMFKGTTHMLAERERKIREAEIAAKAAEVKVEPSRNVSLVSYDDVEDEDDSDGAPDEIKTVVSYDNHVPEEPVKEDPEKPTKKPRKRKKKTAAIVQEIPDETEDALKGVRATIESHVESFGEPPVPGEENYETDAKIEVKSQVANIEDKSEIDKIDCPEAMVEDIPGEPQDDVVEEQVPESSKKEVPIVFKKRLRPPTLLERLLLSEIKNERNTILQCVRYVCKNNFFQNNQQK